jgi:hypothetical protein
MSISITDHHERGSSLIMSLNRPYPDGMTSTTSSTSRLDDIAVAIDREGVAALDRPVIDDVLALAAARGASPVLAEVFADELEPAPVRERAFGLLAMQIASGRRSRFQFTLAA